MIQATASRPGARKKALNILYLGTLPPHPGGSAVMCGTLIAGLSRSGHRIRALAPITTEAFTLGDPFAAANPDIEVVRMEVPYNLTNRFVTSPEDYQRLEDRHIAEKLPRLIAQERPDVMLLGRDNFINDSVRISAEHSIPSVLIIHASPFLLYKYSHNERQLTDAFERICQEITLLITMAKHRADELKDMGLRHVEVVPNPVDLQLFQPKAKDPALLKRLNIGPDATVILHASNLKPVKRPLDIVKSATQALEKDPKLTYVIAGEGPCRNIMENACEAEGIAEAFRFPGWIDYQHMPSFLNLADIVAMPSETETQAMVYLESQACGSVVLTSDIAAAREYFIDGETGVLFRMGDTQHMAEMTLRLAKDHNLRKTIGRNGLQAVQRHALERSVECYERLLHGVSV